MRNIRKHDHGATLLKLTFVHGMREIVLNEISKYKDLHLIESGNDKIYIDLVSDFKNVLTLKSVLNVYVVKRGINLNPSFISRNKSMLSGLIEIVLNGRYKFKTFKLGCADSESKEVRKIRDYITATYKLISAENADMEIYIGKTDNIWDMGVRLTPRPLSLRDYRVANIEGGLNPTIAYAINTFCNLDLMHSYLNIFSGSGTLLIEAGRLNDKLKLVGFDINGKSNALAVQNIKKAGQIRLIQLKTADIFNRPDLGKFDVITSDLPFGMKIYKNNNLNKLYQCFVNYSEEILNKKGVLVVYTTEYKLLNAILQKSKFAIVKTLDLKVPTSISASFIYPKIFVCNLK